MLDKWVVLWLALMLPSSALARPEKIHAGDRYYSDDFVLSGLVRDLGTDKNYEEVYQFYRYYEAVYDDAGRVVTFREYLRGELILSEMYRYTPQGRLLERVVKRPGKPDEVTPGTVNARP